MTTESESSLQFDYNGLATWPLWLHYTRVLDFYAGDALMADGHFRRFSRHLFVPPNVAAVVLLGRNNQRLTLYPGRYHLQSALKGHWPVSAQFVRLDVMSFAIEKLPVPTDDLLYFEVDLWVSVRVTDPALATELREPLDDVRNALKQKLMKRLRVQKHDDVVRIMPALVEEGVAHEVSEEFVPHGLKITVGLTRLEPDAAWKDLQRRAATVDKDGEVRRREAQREEDVFALQQPGLRRQASVAIATQMREKNQQARLDAIEAVEELSKAFVEDLRRHPGRTYTEKDMQPLLKALELLDKLAQPVPAPQFPTQIRSYFALDATNDPRTAVPPPFVLPDDGLPVPPGSVWDHPKDADAGEAV
ncbi:MAG: hypothetical protein KA764_11825 [Anaerolineales bacterium]|nr:hypothetical protein [Anaerolineales bacterium]